MLLLLLILALAAGLAVGFVVGKGKRTPPELKVDQVALTKHRILVDTLYDQAADHMTLDEPFATIAFDEIRKMRKELA